MAGLIRHRVSPKILIHTQQNIDFKNWIWLQVNFSDVPRASHVDRTGGLQEILSEVLWNKLLQIYI